jgi:hypothetical protein
MSLILKMNDWLTCKEGFDKACFNSLDEQLVSNLLEDEQDLSVGGMLAADFRQPEHLLCYGLNFILQLTRH